MMIHEYAEALDNAVKFKESGKSFEQYEKEVQSKMQPIECQMMWVMAEYVMDKTAEVVNKETAELAKLLGEKDAKLTKQKEMLNKYYGNFNADGVEFADRPIGRVIFNTEEKSGSYDCVAYTFSEGVGTVTGRGLDVTIIKNQITGNWFVVTDLDTGSKRCHRLNDIKSYTELRYPKTVNKEPAPIPEDLPKKFDPDKRVKKCEPSITEICGCSDAHFNGEYHGEEPDSSNYGDNGGGF